MKDRNYLRVAIAFAASALTAATPLQAQMDTSSAARQLGVDSANFDRSVRPQDDFFRFVNGTWLRTTEIPEDRSTYGAFVELDDASQEALKVIVEEAASADHPPGSVEQKVGDFYASFMDSATVERLRLEPLQGDLRRIAALRDQSELPEMFAYLARQGVQTPIGFYVSPDGRDATRYVAYATQSGLGLPDRDYYLEADPELAEARRAYTGYAERLLDLAGVTGAGEAAAAILELETAIAREHWERARNRDPEATYNAYDVADLDSLMQGFSWPRYLAATDAFDTPILVIRQPDYFAALDSLITATPIATWKDYLTLKLLDEYADFLPQEFVEASFDFHERTLQGLTDQRPRWKRGVDATEAALGMQLGRIYVDRHFRPEAKQRMDALVDNLIAAFRAGIDELEWMSPATRAQAQEKLAKFRVKIAYPDVWPEHAGLEVARGDLIGNVQRADRFEFQEMVDDLGQPIDEDEWVMTPQTVNAYYHPTLNEIVFPAAILQPPFFNFAADDAVNYGAIGAVIGHEISHGFDDQGRRYDGDGNLRDWWTAEDEGAFEQRADRLVEQYGGYAPLEGMAINGRLTLGENIGDLSGLAVAYDAYQRSLGGEEAPIIGGFTGDQRFFLGWAQIWRTLFREEALRQRLLTDSHSPGEYRVYGVLRNMDEFHAAFHVEPGDGMYLPPEERVEIW